MKMKAVLSTASGYRQFMANSKRNGSELRESMGDEVDKIINCK